MEQGWIQSPRESNIRKITFDVNEPHTWYTVILLLRPILGDPGAVSRVGRKGGTESFQVRTKEPLGTYSLRTISKTSSGCHLLIGRKKCFVLLCPIGEHILMSSFRVFVHDGYLDHDLSSLRTKEMLAVRKLSVWCKILIWFNSLTLPNASKLFWTISKFMERMILLLLVYVLHKTWNWSFTGSRAVEGKEMYKKAWCTSKIVVLSCQAIWISHRRRILIVIRQKQNILRANSIALADSNPNVFSTHR